MNYIIVHTTLNKGADIKMIHHGFKKGKRVYVRLNNGIEIIDKFINSTSKFLILENNKIKWSDINCTTIYKQRI